VASFAGEEEGSKTFVRGSGGYSGSSRSGDVYKLESSTSSTSARTSSRSELSGSQPGPASTTPGTTPFGGAIMRATGGTNKHRQMDDFLSELRSKQDTRGSRGSGGGNDDRHDRDRHSDRDNEYERDRDRGHGRGDRDGGMYSSRSGGGGMFDQAPAYPQEKGSFDVS
jgi:hypothetical protein